MQTFYATYGIYHSCLNFMGFDPSNEVLSRYFAIGFNVTAAIDAQAMQNAIGSSLNNTVCTTNLAPTENLTYYPAGKTLGSFGMVMTPYAADTSLGDHASVATQIFSVGSTGAISDGTPPSLENSSRWSISEKKILRNHRAGY